MALKIARRVTPPPVAYSGGEPRRAIPGREISAMLNDPVIVAKLKAVDERYAATCERLHAKYPNYGIHDQSDRKCDAAMLAAEQNARREKARIMGFTVENDKPELSVSQLLETDWKRERIMAKKSSTDKANGRVTWDGTTLVSTLRWAGSWGYTVAAVKAARKELCKTTGLAMPSDTTCQIQNLRGRKDAKNNTPLQPGQDKILKAIYDKYKDTPSPTRGRAATAPAKKAARAATPKKPATKAPAKKAATPAKAPAKTAKASKPAAVAAKKAVKAPAKKAAAKAPATKTVTPTPTAPATATA